MIKNSSSPVEIRMKTSIYATHKPSVLFSFSLKINKLYTPFIILNADSALKTVSKQTINKKIKLKKNLT